MIDANSKLEEKIRETLRSHQRNGNKVAAIKYYHDVTMTPLLESKRFMDSFHLDGNSPIGNEKYHQFLRQLEERDFGGAAATLLDDLNPMPANEAIEKTIRISKLLELDVTALEVPSTLGFPLWESPHAQAIVTERALLNIRERMIQRLLQKGTSRGEAEKLVDEANASLAQADCRPPDPQNVLLEGLEPSLVSVLRSLLGPVPISTTIPLAASAPRDSDSAKPPEPKIEAPASLLSEVWIRRIGEAASLVYGLCAIIGMVAIVYSYQTLPISQPFSMNENLPTSEQSLKIEKWLNETIPAHSHWFVSSVSEAFTPVRLEPGLPLAFAGETWPWEKKIASINSSANEMTARIQRCHEEILLLYGIAFLSAGVHWFRRDRISGILMVSLSVLGMPFLVSQFWRWQFESSLWLGPLLVPGAVALAASILDLVLVSPKTNRRKELRAFWFGAIGFALSILFLIWSILQGNQLRPGAGLGVIGCTWLMLHHGWRYLRNKNGTCQTEQPDL